MRRRPSHRSAWSIGRCAAAAVAIAWLGHGALVAATFPAPPRAFLDTTPVAPTGQTIDVPADGDFQAALDSAQPGDMITLQAGATYTGSFVLPAKSGTGWITVRTSAPDSSLPPYGSRITPASAAVLPKIVSPGSTAALATAPNAHHYRFIGIEFTVASDVTTNYGIVTLGDGSAAQSSLAEVPYALVFDRVYVHGHSTLNVSRGFALNSASTAVINSYVSEIHGVGFDTQAISGWNGPGPFTIANNYLEAAGENVLFGGADPFIPNLVPSDIDVRGNHMFKPLSWMQGHSTYAGTPWTVKNLFELKNARRVVIDGNVFEHNWPDAQNGFAILFTVRNQDGNAPWSTVADVTFTHNIVRHVANGVNILGQDDIHASQQQQRIVIQDNLFDDVSSANWGGHGRLFQILNGVANLTIDHNTAFQTGDIIGSDQDPNSGFTFTNNVAPNNLYGVGGANTYGNPVLTLDTYFPDAVFTNNAIVGVNSPVYPSGNFFPQSFSDVGFVAAASGNYALGSVSIYSGAATDGTAVGVSWTDLTARTSGAASGQASAIPPPSPDTTAPTVSISAPLGGATVSGTTTVTAPGSDDTGVSKVIFQVDGVTFAIATVPPYQATWNTTTSLNGSRALTAVAVDLGGNQTTSSPEVVNVFNAPPPPAISAVSVSSITSSSAVVTWTTNVGADAKVQYGTTSGYGSTTTLDPGLVTSHTQSLSGLLPSTQYHYRVLSRDDAGALVVSADAVFTTAAPPANPGVPVIWTAMVNATATTTLLTKTGGCDGCQDAGAVSLQTIGADGGAVEFTIDTLATLRAIGLSHGSAHTISGIDFGLLLWPGYVEVRESGSYRSETSAAVGDLFRIAVSGSVVTYSKNGTVFYQGAVSPAYPLVVNTSLLHAGSTISNAVIVATVTPVAPAITWPAPAAVTYGTALSATQLNATASVPGAFVYSPAAGTLPAVGVQTLSVTFTPTDAAAYTTATTSVALTVSPATPAITWPEPAATTFGTALSVTTLNATAAVPGAFVYTPAEGTVLNAGVHMLSVTFTPTDTTTYTSATVTVPLTVNQQTPAIAWATPAAITYGTALSATQLKATAPVPGTFVYTPPAGTVLAAGSQTLSVTFTPTDAANYTNATATVTIEVRLRPVITSAAATTFTVGAAGTFAMTATGSPTPTLSEIGTLPAGVTFNATTGVLSGTPAAGTGRIYSITLRAANAAATVSQAFKLTVVQAPAITSATAATFTLGIAKTFSVKATGFPAPALSMTGTLPGGVTFVPATGILSGTPAAGSSGIYPLTFTAANGVGAPAVSLFTLTVNQAAAITSGASTTFTVGAAGTFTVTATGFPAPTLTRIGTLPAGVTFDGTTGVLSGTPAAGSGRNYAITFRATNAVGTVSQTFTLTVLQAPKLTSAAATTFTLGVAKIFVVKATGFTAATLGNSGALPDGITFDAATGMLSGTAAGAKGLYPITFTATNGVGADAVQNFTLTVR